MTEISGSADNITIRWEHESGQPTIRVWTFDLKRGPDTWLVHLAGSNGVGQIIKNNTYRVYGENKNDVFVAEYADNLTTDSRVKFGFEHVGEVPNEEQWTGTARNLSQAAPWFEVWDWGWMRPPLNLTVWEFELFDPNEQRHAVRLAGEKCLGHIRDLHEYRIHGAKRDGLVLVSHARDLDVSKGGEVRCKTRSNW